MLLRQQCPHTGVINFFSPSEPQISVGSIVEATPSRYVWRSHVGEPQSGTARDLTRAEAHLLHALGLRWQGSRSRTPSRDGPAPPRTEARRW
jgi:hypothetical protein